MENKLTPGSNLLWESSRMMLPEHKALLRQHEESRIKQEKPNYDDQVLTQLAYQIEVALNQNRTANITYYEQGAHHRSRGVITAIDHEKQLIQLSTDIKGQRFHLTDLISIELD